MRRMKLAHNVLFGLLEHRLLHLVSSRAPRSKLEQLRAGNREPCRHMTEDWEVLDEEPTGGEGLDALQDFLHERHILVIVRGDVDAICGFDDRRREGAEMYSMSGLTKIEGATRLTTGCVQ